MPDKSYRVREFPNIAGLRGLSDAQLQQHFKLYEGYIKQTNLLQEQLDEMLRKGQADTPIFAEISRRISFEKNGMVLHELYFDTLVRAGKEMTSRLKNILEYNFGTVDGYRTELDKLCRLRGVGWVITSMDPVSRRLFNNWVTLHQDGNIAGFRPILVIDVWEHAWTVDYKPTERTKYLDALFSNIDWNAVELRLSP